MVKASITYHAIEGEPKGIGWNGYFFEDGKATDVYDADMIERARTNRFFKVGHVDEHAGKPSPPSPKQETAHEPPSHAARAPQGQTKK